MTGKPAAAVRLQIVVTVIVAAVAGLFLYGTGVNGKPRPDGGSVAIVTSTPPGFAGGIRSRRARPDRRGGGPVVTPACSDVAAMMAASFTPLRTAFLPLAVPDTHPFRAATEALPVRPPTPVAQAMPGPLAAPIDGLPPCPSTRHARAPVSIAPHRYGDLLGERADRAPHLRPAARGGRAAVDPGPQVAECAVDYAHGRSMSYARCGSCAASRCRWGRAARGWSRRSARIARSRSLSGSARRSARPGPSKGPSSPIPGPGASCSGGRRSRARARWASRCRSTPDRSSE